MLAMFIGTLAGATNTEISPAEFTPIGPRLRPGRQEFTELLIKSTTQPLTLRLGGSAGDAIDGSISRIVFASEAGARPLRKSLEGTLIEYGNEVIKLTFSGLGDQASTATHTYEIDLDSDRTLAQILEAVAARLSASAGVATATINGGSKARGTIIIHDSADPAEALLVTKPATASAYVYAEGPFEQAGFPVAPAECPVQLNGFSTDVITAHVAAAEGAAVVMSAQVL